AQRAAGLAEAGKLGEKAVAEGQFVDQCATLADDMAYLPLAAAVEQGQLPLVPLPAGGEPLEQQALPAFAAPARWHAEFFADLQVQAAADQFQALLLAALQQVLFEAAIDDDVRVELVEVELVGEYRLLETQGQTAHLRVFAGIDLGKQQFEHRLEGRLDALVQLPHAGADELMGGDTRQVAEVEHLVGTHEALVQQGLGVLRVAGFLVHRHQPPEWCASAQPDGGAVELVEQQVVLGGTAVVGGQLAVAFATAEALRINQKAVHLGTLGRRPGFQQAAFALQFEDGSGWQLRVVADPQVHVALLGLRHGTQAAHQEQAMQWRLALAARRLVDEGAGQALCFGEQ